MNRRLPVPALTVMFLSVFAVHSAGASPNPDAQTAAAKKVTAAKQSEPASAPVTLISVNGVNDIDPTKATGSRTQP